MMYDYNSDVSEENEGFQCSECQKVLPTEIGLKNHKLSKVHVKRRFRCAFCPRRFLTPAFMIMHLEQGECGNMTRSDIFYSVQSWEVATGQYNLLTAYEFQESSNPGATQNSFSGYSFRCPMCPRKFVKLFHLDQHLNSVAHEAANYHCPRCEGKFKLLSAVIQHLEYRKCDGPSYKHVKKIVRGIVPHMRRLKLS